MSRGKHLSLSEARKSGQLDRYAKEHPSVGDRDAFNRVLKAMASGGEEVGEARALRAAEDLGQRAFLDDRAAVHKDRATRTPASASFEAPLRGEHPPVKPEDRLSG